MMDPDFLVGILGAEIQRLIGNWPREIGVDACRPLGQIRTAWRPTTRGPED
jgi:hypothetical protein